MNTDEPASNVWLSSRAQGETPDLETLTDEIFGLGQAQAKLLEGDFKAYLLSHFGDRRILRGEIRLVMEYARWIPQGATVLDWGCGPALPSLVLSRLRPDLELRAANFDTEIQCFKLLWEAARLDVLPLQHDWVLPYADNSLDVVISKGVLEHVPHEQMSLAEIYRVLRHEGKLIVTALPSRYSLLEWFNRICRRSHHIRLYTLRGAKKLLLSCGFHIAWSGFRIACPLATPWAEPVFRIWERVPAARNLTQNLVLMGVKSSHGIGGDQMYSWGNLQTTLQRFESSSQKAVMGKGGAKPK